MLSLCLTKDSRHLNPSAGGSLGKDRHTGRSVTHYNLTGDLFTGFHAVVVPGTIRDSLFIPEGLLEQQLGLCPHVVTSDTAG